jgi:hypothetical protein
MMKAFAEFIAFVLVFIAVVVLASLGNLYL